MFLPRTTKLCSTLMDCHEKWHEHVNVWSFLVIVITKTMPLCKKQSRHNKQKTETLNYLHLHIFKAVWQSNNVIHSRKILLKLQGEKDNNVLETQHFRYQNNNSQNINCCLLWNIAAFHVRHLHYIWSSNNPKTWSYDQHPERSLSMCWC